LSLAVAAIAARTEAVFWAGRLSMTTRRARHDARFDQRRH
jgi:hypothetical protein